MSHTFLSSDVLRLVRQIFKLKHSHLQPFYLQRTRKPRWLPFFSHSCASSSLKDAAPKVSWEKVIPRRSKELKSDPGLCPLFGRHFENLGDVIIYPVLVVARTVLVTIIFHVYQ